MKLIWNLLRENISKAQLIGFFISNLIGMTIILLAFQFYFDINPFFLQKDNLFNRDFFTITKKVGFFDTFSSGQSGFTTKEIEELRNSGFVKDIGVFTSSQYTVYASLSRNGSGFGTDMFFESVPHKFIDVKTDDDWQFSPVDNTVPIILPKNYLDLYNFGFAESRSMPKISENMIGMINLDISIMGRGSRHEMKGKVVGFSNRLNTILVPEPFMKWANENFGNKLQENPARLVLEVNNIADPQLAEIFKERGYEVEGDNAVVSRMSSFLKILVSIVIGVGAIICLLSFAILTLSIYLLLEKNMNKLRNLRLLGYKKSVVVRPYELLVIGINAVVLLLSFVFVFIGKSKYGEVIQKIWQNYESVGFLNTTFIGIGIFLILVIVNVLIIRKKVD